MQADAERAQLMDLAYDRLRRLAQSRLTGDPLAVAFDATEVVHETWLRLAGEERSHWRDEAHFFSVAAMVMRRVCVDLGRARSRQRRGGDWRRTTLHGEALAAGKEAADELEILDLHDALIRLERLDARQASVAELRMFGGLDFECCAAMLDVSVVTVRRDWTVARAWLRSTLGGRDDRG